MGLTPNCRNSQLNNNYTAVTFCDNLTNNCKHRNTTAVPNRKGFMKNENDDMTDLLKEIETIVSADIVHAEALELIQVKLSVFLAQHPDEAVRLSEMMGSDFMRRRTDQLLQELDQD